FSSCSPVYGYILATVLPLNFGVALTYMIAYVVGLSAMLLLVGFLGQKLVRKIRWAANPRGWFQRVVAILFIATGLLIVTGWNTQFQVWISEHTPFNFDALSSSLIVPTSNSPAKTTGGVLNVANPYNAPNFTGISTWINSKPLNISELKGKVVLIDFWTYSCINCIRTQPYLKDLYAKYHDAGLEIIGVHAPEFSFEKNPDNVKKAVKDAGLNYPIAMDNDLLTWGAYGNQYWPATYLIDKDGQIRRTHNGEGEYSEEEQAVRTLLAEKGGKVPGQATTQDASVNDQPITPETYLGYTRAGNYIGQDSLTFGNHTYRASDLSQVNQWTLSGTWSESEEGITAVKDSVLTYRVMAQDVYLVTGNNKDATLDVKINGKPASDSGSAGDDIKNSQLHVDMAQLYNLAHFSSYNSDATIEIHVPAGVQLNTFTFG
ncbi:MAG: hypothetical protein JWO07_317, partial [Candidatus Saccharibacteria bacterium]|nr:hypothetical protein [Candidatus Saccharibacteria bacterium]